MKARWCRPFDHRAASVVVNPENLNRPAQPREATSEECANPDWLPDPQFWVSIDDAEWPGGLGWIVAFKHVGPDECSDDDRLFGASRRFWQQSANSVIYRRNV